MLSHVMLGVSNFDRALAFYQPLMRCLGLEQRFCDPAHPWAGWHSPGGGRPLFIIAGPYDGQPHHPGNGQMLAFQAANRATVNQVHALALTLGAQDEGAPGLRPHYHPHYWGAYLRDTEGNKLCVACHEEEG